MSEKVELYLIPSVSFPDGWCGLSATNMYEYFPTNLQGGETVHILSPKMHYKIRCGLYCSPQGSVYA